MIHLKLWFNMIINALTLLMLSALVSTGLLIHYVLPKGSGGGLSAGFGHGRMKPILNYLGFTRHEWGEIHFWIAVLFLLLLVSHLILHWSWIRCIAWGTKSKPQSKIRKLITIGIVTWIILIFSFPFIFEKKMIQRDNPEVLESTQIKEKEADYESN